MPIYEFEGSFKVGVCFQIEAPSEEEALEQASDAYVAEYSNGTVGPGGLSDRNWTIDASWSEIEIERTEMVSP